ncbi:hypothetical protein [Latilactobacillus phage TMW 1.1365 P3]|uniref:hypothetical protein n=1 Tax=Latilactobacillus curvatus TaxID=28038 RepID=UPI00240F1D57|nr:hypothetical protein [Latilactobacillus curvatus]MDG2981263.1 hypothetical protein [Latilactobacillus curvatus]MDG2983070.1 hypothetical protein [Latilactobacillus curvatus]WEU69558.1 hypothetical protein [Latilactobacillus phage TMW 1.1365 P3]WEU69684.1 hypothetical protein [Latilactobacillus phage TMW 1.1447 P1]
MKSLDKVVLGVFVTSLFAIGFGPSMVIICAISGGYLLRSINTYSTKLFGEEDEDGLDVNNDDNLNTTGIDRH